MIEQNYRNKNRGYQQLRVWDEAIDYYVLTCRTFRKFPYELKRVTSQAIASADSVHRNIAEGYCRRSIREYLHFLNVGLGSLGESVSGLYAYQRAGQNSRRRLSESKCSGLQTRKWLVETGREPGAKRAKWRLDR